MAKIERMFRGEKVKYEAQDVTTFPAQLSKAYGEYIAARKLAGEKRDAFEAQYNKLAEDVPANAERLFGYNYGGFSIALADMVKTAPKANATSFKARK
jgi:hypothetical protein